MQYLPQYNVRRQALSDEIHDILKEQHLLLPPECGGVSPLVVMSYGRVHTSVNAKVYDKV
jgi:hypothetical protein